MVMNGDLHILKIAKPAFGATRIAEMSQPDKNYLK
jgi:hypothetical protein